ncbi:MAG: hypothetical protein U1E05_04625, partial [Patescibacteria group bacterium]|nr:hypothetical protein [Patescibacteria group bacterium]
MAIEFACGCGKRLRAAAEHAGKSARCSQCGQIVMIPAATPEDVEVAGPLVAMAGMAASSDLNDLFSSELPPGQPEALTSAFLSPTAAPARAVATSHRPCPSCHRTLPPAAVLCIHCGYNLNTRTKLA